MMLAGRYRLVRRIATGGMGTVHEGLDERLGRRVAIKILKEEYADDVTFVERFGREARATATLEHPHIAQVFDFGRDGDRHFIVMQFIEGKHLGSVLGEASRLPPERTVEIASQVCSALVAAHAAGIVHRDIKPGNVMVRPDGAVMVTDFGIAQIKGQAGLTGIGLILGTAHYLSPEQASGEGATPASDVYAVGVLCYEMLTGTVPFDSDSPVAVALNHIRAEIPSVRDLVPQVPQALAAVVARATAKDPSKRYADAYQMERALRESLGAPRLTRTAVLPVATATIDRPPGGVIRGTGRLRTSGIVAAGFLTAGVLAAGWFILPGKDSPETARPSVQTSQPPSRTIASPAPPSTSTGPSPSAPVRTPAPEIAQPSGGPVVPTGIVGGNVKLLEDQLEERGYDVETVEITADAPEDVVVATIPGPGEPLVAGRSVILIASDGDPPQNSAVVPDGLVGSNAKDAMRLLKDHEFKVEMVDVDSRAPRLTVVAVYPAAGSTAESVVLAFSRGIRN